MSADDRKVNKYAGCVYVLCILMVVFAMAYIGFTLNNQINDAESLPIVTPSADTKAEGLGVTFEEFEGVDWGNACASASIFPFFVLLGASLKRK